MCSMISSSSQPDEVGNNITPILQLRKMKLREFKCIVQDHSVILWTNLILTWDGVVPESLYLVLSYPTSEALSWKDI